jgi:hypothetical protein
MMAVGFEGSGRGQSVLRGIVGFGQVLQSALITVRRRMDLCPASRIGGHVRYSSQASLRASRLRAFTH